MIIIGIKLKKFFVHDVHQSIYKYDEHLNHINVSHQCFLANIGKLTLFQFYLKS